MASPLLSSLPHSAPQALAWASTSSHLRYSSSNRSPWLYFSLLQPILSIDQSDSFKIQVRSCYSFSQNPIGCHSEKVNSEIDLHGSKWSEPLIGLSSSPTTLPWLLLIMLAPCHWALAWAWSALSLAFHSVHSFTSFESLLQFHLDEASWFLLSSASVAQLSLLPTQSSHYLTLLYFSFCFIPAVIV